MKKFLGFIAITLFGVATLGANGTSSPLYKYVKNADGTYGYDTTKPIMFYNGSTEQVEIPDTYVPVKYEFRSSWVATISNLNIANTTNKEAFQTAYMKIMGDFKNLNMNAMIFQIRPLLDAFYPSTLNPWSEFATGVESGSRVVGKQGVDPGWDPLAWMIETTHKEGLEYHAWLNPYRVTNTSYTTATMQTLLGKTEAELLAMSNVELIALLNEKGVLADNNYAVLNPTHVLQFQNKFFLNPGLPEVVTYLEATIREIITNYDVDAIHFDDYFYPYRVGEAYFGSNNEDRETFLQYGASYPDTVEGIESWRRDNVTALIERLDTLIDTHNTTNAKAVQLGISPFGIWEHKVNHPDGSNTPAGSSMSYSKSIFADTRKWIKEGHIDYVVPQIYWSFDQGAAPYGELARWWNDVVEGTDTHLYVGHPNYKYVGNGGWEAAWMNPDEIMNQLKFNQTLNNVKGSVFFSHRDIIETDISTLPVDQQPKNEAKNISVRQLNELYNNAPVLLPPMTHLTLATPTALPTGDVVGSDVTWAPTDETTARFYAVYRTPKDSFTTAEALVNTPGNLIGRYGLDVTSFTQPTTRSATQYVYAVTVIDVARNESQALVLNAPVTTGVTPPVVGGVTPSGPSLPATGIQNRQYLPILLLTSGMAIVIISKVRRKISE